MYSRNGRKSQCLLYTFNKLIMILSKTPTNWIVIKADTSDEYVNIDLALVSLNDIYIASLAKRLVVCKELKDVPTLQYVAFSDDIDFWISADSDNEEDIVTILTEKGWSYVILDNDEIDGYVSSTVRTQTERLKVYPDGTAFYTAQGKNTDVEYYTIIIPLNTIVEAYEPN